MLLWNKFYRNLILLIFDLIVTFFLIFRDLLNYKDENYENDVYWLMIFTDIFLIIFTNTVVLLSINNNNCFLEVEYMESSCVVCWDSSNNIGIRCKVCGQVSICYQCYIIWSKRGNTCPLCRSIYNA